MIQQPTNYIVTSIQADLSQGHIDASELLTKMKSWAGGESYYCVHTLEKRPTFKGYQGPTELALGWFVLDIDSDKTPAGLEKARLIALDIWKNLPITPDTARIYFSGQKGFHIYIREELISARTPKEYEAFAESIKKTYPNNIDTSIYTANHKLRLPNSRHPSTGLFKREISLAELQSSIENIQALAKTKGLITLDKYVLPVNEAQGTAAPGPLTLSSVGSGVFPSIDYSALIYKEQVETPLTEQVLKERDEILKSWNKIGEDKITVASGVTTNKEGNIVAVGSVASFGTENAIPADLEPQIFKDKKCIETMWASVYPEGDRHQIAMALIIHSKEIGMDEKTLEQRLHIWAQNNNISPSRFEKDYIRAISQQYSGETNYTQGCYGGVTKRHCVNSCALFTRLDKAKRADLPDPEPTALEAQALAIIPAQQITSDDDFIEEDPELIDVKNGAKRIKFKDLIASGFHTAKETKTGVVYIPEIERLRKFFHKLHPYVSLKESNMTCLWNGTHYEDVSDIQIKMFSHKFLKPIPKPGITKHFLERIQHTNPVSLQWFKESTKYKINFKNGVFDTETGEFKTGHSMDRGFKYCLPYDYDPTAQAPLFSHMLEKVTSGDTERANVILEYMGYALSDSPCFSDKILVMFGEGSNGKTRFLNVMRAILGSAAIGLGPKDFEKDAKLRKLNGALLSITEEMPAFTQKEFWERIKDLSSGGELTVDVKYKDAISFPNRCKLVFTCNKLPLGTDPTHGFFRRLLLVPFDHTFSPNDPDFTPDIDVKIIESELSGVFNMIWAALKRLKANKYRFGESRVVSEQIERYKIDVDSVARWALDNEIHLVDQFTDKDVTFSLDLYKDYKSWADDREMHPVGYTEFAKRLTKRVDGLESRVVRRRNNENKKATGYLGIGLGSPQPKMVRV